MRALTDAGQSVQIVKAVQSGVPCSMPSDADWALSTVTNSALASARTLFSFGAPGRPFGPRKRIRGF